MSDEQTTRGYLEQRVIDRDIVGFITPISVGDYGLFRQFGNGYKNTLTYNAQAVNGWNPRGESRYRLGLKYCDGSNLMSFGSFLRRITQKGEFLASSRHFHLIPCESSPEKITELAGILYGVSHSSVYIKKISKEQRDILLSDSRFVNVDETNGWYEPAPLEDDTYPERIIDLETTLQELEKNRKDSQVSDKYTRAVRRYVDPKRLRIEQYDPTVARQREDALKIVDEFFNIQEEKDNHLSFPEDYFNIVNLKPTGVDYFSSIFYVDEKPAAFYFAESVENTLHVYANLTLRDEFKYLSEFILVHLFQEAFGRRVKKANLGGSETRGLDEFKQKFRPMEQNQMHWLLYRGK